MKDRHVVGRRLRTLRVERRIRQVDLAARVGIRASRLCAIESDADYCGDFLALDLAWALDVPLAAFTDPGPHPNTAAWRRPRTAEAA